MTADQQEQAAGGDAFGQYVNAMEAVPRLGYVVWYSVFDGNVMPHTLAAWFTELGLDPALLPRPLRADGAFEVATSNATASYPVPGRAAASAPAASAPAAPARRGRRDAPADKTVTLMVRRVRRDAAAIVCHLVREVRDAGASTLRYKTELAEVTFARDQRKGAAPGAGTLQVTPHPDAIPPREQEQVTALLDELSAEFSRRSRYLTGDQIRAMLRAYVESLNAIRIRPTGGVYFVHQHNHGTLAALRTLLTRFGAGSNLVCVPLPDQDELREMVIEAWRAKQREDMQKLSADIAAAQAAATARGGQIAQATAESLYGRFRALQAETSQHSQLLSTDLADADAAMNLAGAQVMALLAQVG
ncbi:MAG: DUF6744 family protein [Streptosporangiaceae bacterium]